jgi:hypothetical protein
MLQSVANKVNAGRDPVEPRPGGVTSGAASLGAVLQQEGHSQVDLVAGYVAVLDQDVHVLDPRPLHTPKRLGGTGDCLVDGVLEARLGRGAQLGDSRNAQAICLP